ncbi:MAG: helix-turn-helix domain-containing protein [Pseudonocardiaceae bacterium]
MIRRRRGLSLDVVAGLAGIGEPYLSMLEQGQRGFNRRGLLEDLADALGCSVADLTGQPSPPDDRGTADVLAVIAQVTPLLYDITLDHAPDLPARPVDQLATWAAQANTHCDEARYALAGKDLSALLTDLHIHPRRELQRLAGRRWRLGARAGHRGAQHPRVAFRPGQRRRVVAGDRRGTRQRARAMPSDTTPNPDLVPDDPCKLFAAPGASGFRQPRCPKARRGDRT